MGEMASGLLRTAVPYDAPLGGKKTQAILEFYPATEDTCGSDAGVKTQLCETSKPQLPLLKHVLL